jgi:hypothetical protein
LRRAFSMGPISVFGWALKFLFDSVIEAMFIH